MKKNVVTKTYSPSMDIQVSSIFDSQLFERSIIFSCKKKSIPIIMMQNGDL